MPLTWQEIVYGLAIPLAIAATVCRLVDAWASVRAGGAFALVAGIESGYWLLGLGEAVPEAHWEWLPYALLLLVPASLVPGRSGSSLAWRWGLLAAAAGLAAWLIVPARNDLQPPRAMAIGLVLAATLLGGWAVERALGRDSAKGHWAALAAVLATASCILLLSGSLRFAQMAGVALAAYVGIAVAQGLAARSGSSLAFPLTYFVAAAMMIGHANSFSAVPAASYLLVAAAPIALVPIPGRGGPTSRWLSAAAPWLFCLVALALALQAEFGSGGY